MKKIILLGVGIIFLITGVSAYQVHIYAPASLTAGLPLVVNGTTTFGIGMPLDVVLYQQVTTSTEIDRRVAYVQSDNTFRVIFDTTGLTPGIYNVGVPASGTGDSIIMREVRIINRSDEILLSSQTNQVLSGSLYLSGQIAAEINSGVQIAVIGPDNSVIFGPAYVGTASQGMFNLTVPVSEPGDYDVSFTDAQGYIGTRTIHITGGTATVTPGTTAITATLTAHGSSSRDNPVFFAVQPSGNDPVTVSTSASVDWVVEYADASGNIRTFNEQSDAVPEAIVINDTDNTLYFKVYPTRYSVTDDVSLTATNADSIAVSESIPDAFGQAQSSQPSATQSPIAAETGIIALGTAVLCCHLHRR